MNRKPNNVTPIESKVQDEEKAFDFMMMHFNRVVTMDEVNRKAIKRAGKTGEAIHALLGSIELYARVRRDAKQMRLNNASTK